MDGQLPVGVGYHHSFNTESFQHHQPQFSHSMFQQNEIEYLRKTMDMHRHRAIRAETILVEDFINKRRSVLKIEEEQDEKDIMGFKELYGADSSRFQEKHKRFMEKIKQLDGELHNLKEIEQQIKTGLMNDSFTLDDLRVHGYPDDFTRLKNWLSQVNGMKGGAGSLNSAFSAAGPYGQNATNILPSTASWTSNTTGQFNTEFVTTNHMRNMLIQPSTITLSGAEPHIPLPTPTANINGVIGSKAKSNFSNVNVSGEVGSAQDLKSQMPTQQPVKSNAQPPSKSKAEVVDGKNKDRNNEKQLKTGNGTAQNEKNGSEPPKAGSKGKASDTDQGVAAKSSKKVEGSAAKKGASRTSPTASLTLSDTGTSPFDLEEFGDLIIDDSDDFDLQRILPSNKKEALKSEIKTDWSNIAKRNTKPKTQKTAPVQPVQAQQVHEPLTLVVRKESENMEDNPAYKTRLCSYYEAERFCIRGNKCPYAHGQKELRQYGGVQNSEHGHNFAQSLFKSRLCKNWSENSTCPHGERCVFAHGEKELRKSHDPVSVLAVRTGYEHDEPCGQQQCPQKLDFLLFKTRECANPACTRGSERCRYAHNKTELRALPKFELCERAMDGYCPLPASKCVYAHYRTELRPEPDDFWKRCGPVKGQANTQDEECMICSGALNNQAPRYQLNCSGKHSNWHFSCISQWVNEHSAGDGTCPMCRESVDVPTTNEARGGVTLANFFPTRR